MNKPRRFENAVSGEELFGSRLADDLAAVEIYPADQAELLEIHRCAGKLVEGGPPVDRERIRELQIAAVHSDAARQSLAELNRYIPWFRTAYAMGELEA